jgi:sugar O-acyltransferase (sialic acid O-acetyltransferase NeuD family)
MNSPSLSASKPLVIFGAAELAEIAWFYFTHDAAFNIKAFAVDAQFIRESTFCGLPVVAFEDVQKEFPPAAHDLFVAVSYAQLNRFRAERCAQAKAKGYALRTYVSSKATVWPDLVLGENCFILEDNTVQPFVTIGSNVTLWSGNHIGHHSTIGDNCFITSHVVISGGVQVGRNCFIGVNTTVRDHVSIGDRCLIGAGSLILESTQPNTVYVANTTGPSEKPKPAADR